MMPPKDELTGLAKRCDWLSFQLARLATWFAGALFLVNVGDMLMGVVARYIFHSSPMWTEELARYTLIWMVMLAANPALRYGEHMQIDLVIKRFPAKAQSLLQWVRRLVIVTITGLMSYLGLAYTLKISMFNTMGLGISKSIPLAAIPVGFFLLMVQFLLMQFASTRNK
jgi:TRAP-type C4-dicarboxylate transport system permease small subunit